MKKIGIVCDNYKLKKFKKALRKKGWVVRTMPFTAQETTIFIIVEEDQVEEVGKVCMELELGFKRSN